MAKSPFTASQLSPDGLRYAKKPNGSVYGTGASRATATMSCFRCGRHRPRELMVFKRLVGRSHLVCEPNCESVAQQLAAG